MHRTRLETFEDPRDAREYVQGANDNVYLGGRALDIAWADYEDSPQWEYGGCC